MHLGGVVDDGDRDEDGHECKLTGDDHVPHYVVAMTERQTLGGEVGMARAAFLFSLEEICTTLCRINLAL